jgi:thiaminase/transcriptional activator TenA
MAFTRELWKSIEPIYAAILEHPFLRGLTDGSLPRESFKFYAVQDALYLREFARALSLAAARAPEDDWIIMFNEHAAGALKVERALHEGFFKDFGLTPADVRPDPPGADEPRLHELPPGGCLRLPISRVHGRAPALLLDLLGGRQGARASGSADPLYKRWIGTYASEEFGAVVRAVLAATDQVAARLTASEREAMRGHFLATSRYEWMFWDMGLRREAWPIS